MKSKQGPKYTMMSLELDSPEQLKEMKRLARRAGVSVSKFIEGIIHDAYRASKAAKA